MDNITIVKAYFAALDSADVKKVDQYLSSDYRLVDFMQQPMDKNTMLDLIHTLKAALPDLNHSLSNIRTENNLVKVTVQISGTNTGNLDLRKMGMGIIPRTRKFIICPSANYEFTIEDGKITTERDISPISSNRRFSGILKAFGVDAGA